MNNKAVHKFFQSLGYIGANMAEVSKQERIFRVDNGYETTDSIGKDGREVIDIGNLKQESEDDIRGHLSTAINDLKCSLKNRKNLY